MDKILLEKDYDQKVAVISINRPDKRNALDGDVLNGLVSALVEVRDDPRLHVLVTRGNGTAFSSGMDLYYLREFRKEYRGFHDWGNVKSGARVAMAIADFPKPSIAAVQGYCLGAAFSLMMAHDVVVVADDAQIGMPEVLRGSFGQGVTAQLVKEGIPRKKAVLLQMLGRNISGAEAERMGLATLTVASDQLDTTAMEIAVELASRNPAVLAHGKIAMHLDAHLPLHHAIFSDDMVAARMRRSIDPLGDVEGYLQSQKGGTNRSYVASPETPGTT